MPVRIIKLFFAAVHDFFGAWPRLLATDVIYKLVAFVVLTPLVGLILKFFMGAAGSSVLADQDILYFVLSPAGLAALILVGCLSIAIVSLEQGCLMAIGVGEIRGLKVTVGDALWTSARHAWSIIVLALRVFLRCLLVALPFLIVGGLAYLLLLREHDINYYLTEKPPTFLVTAGIIATLIVIMAALIIRRLISWSFALPLVLFEGMTPAAAMTTSEERVAGHRWSIALLLVAWGVVAALLSWLPLAVADWVANWLVPAFSGSINRAVFAMGLVILLWALLSLVVTLVNSAMLALLITRLYHEHGASSEARLSSSELSVRLAEGSKRRRISATAVVAALVIAAVLAGAIGYTLLDRVRMVDDVVVIAHRGAAGSAPENTLASVAMALDRGADIVEIDVQEIADGTVVVIHDSDLMKVGGSPLKVWEAGFDEVRAIDIGSWYGPEFAGQRVPTLAEVLEMCKGRARVDIELKYYGHNDRLEERVAEIVREVGMDDQVIAMSLKADIAASMKAIAPRWPVGLLTAKAVGDLSTADHDFLAVHAGIASPGFIRRAHKAGKEVYVWTVNDRLNMSRMMSRGVDGVITDYPGLAREVLADRAELSSLERLMITAALAIGLEPDEPPATADIDG